MSGNQKIQEELRQPEIPEGLSTPEELLINLQQETKKWLTYLNEIENYVTLLWGHIQEQEKTLQSHKCYAEMVTTE